MVKRALGVMIAAPSSGARGARVSRRVLAYCALVDAIRDSSLLPGTRLPSSRQLAAEWGFTRGAVDEALAQLQQEGLVERRVGDGTYVSAGAATLTKAGSTVPVMRPISRSAQQVLERFSVYLGKPQRSEVPVVMLAEQPLFPRAPTLDQFPLDVWRKLITRAHTEAYRDHLTYGAAAGLPRLREAIARHLSLVRGMAVSARQVLVVNSPLHAMELITRVLLEPGDKVWLEDPGHTSMVTLFQVLRAQVVGVPLDSEGLDVAAGRALAPDAAAVYFHPVTQYPLGVRTTTQRLEQLMQWADQSGAWIIEGNFNDEITHDRQHPASLQSMDVNDRVLMMGTLEGIMYPSLRVAYLVVSERLSDVFVAMRGLLGDHTNTALQLALTWFIEEGHLNAHLRNLRQVVRTRRDALRESCAKHLPPWVRLGPLDSGTHACLHLPADVPDREVVRRIRNAGVIAVSLSSSCIDPSHGNGLIIGYGAFDAAAIDGALAIIGEVLRQTVRLLKDGAYQQAGENR
ncbi:MAG: PLP-dependent aminotransferase family protein [Pseudomonadota bacterium]